MRKNDGIKQAVIQRIAKGQNWAKAQGVGQEKYDVEGETIHTRYCSPPTYKFNLNPNTLRSDYELWICGDESHYYFIPIQYIRQMYNHPEAYPDRHHPEIRVVSVDRNTHMATYAKGGKKMDLREYFCSIL
ncbi:hypothetical protein MJD09_08855 [bacterium]|nr:hypothetical protein [bacterium]